METVNKIAHVVLFVVLILAFACSFGIVYHSCAEREREHITVVKRDTVSRLDTVYVVTPTATDSMVVQYVTRWLPTAGHRRDRVDLPSCEDDPPPSDTLDNTLWEARGDSAEVVIPITQKRYDGDGYTAWISGYEARIDSIHLLRRTDVVTQTIYAKRKRRKWGCVVGIGGGMGTGGLTPHVGVTFGLRLF